MTAPCKDCVDRRVGCHSACLLYKEFRKYVDKRNLARAMANERTDFYLALKAKMGNRYYIEV